jgi:hypothetical protein
MAMNDGPDARKAPDTDDPRYHARITVIFSIVALVMIFIFASGKDRASFVIATLVAAAFGGVLSLVFGRHLHRLLTRSVDSKGRVLVLLAIPLLVALARDAPPSFYGAVLGFIVTVGALTELLRREGSES